MSKAPIDDKKNLRVPWLIMGVIALLLIGMLGWLVLDDDPPPNDLAMIPKWSSDKLQHNPLAIFCSESQRTKADAYASLSPEVIRLEGDGIQRAEVFLSEQTSSLQAFGKITQTDPTSWLWPDGEQMANPFHPMNYLTSCSAIANVAGLRSKFLAHDGKVEEAMLLSLDLAKLGTGMQRAEGTPMHLIAATNIRRIGEDGVLATMMAKGATRDMLVKALAELTKLEQPRRQDVQFAMKADYKYFLNAFDIVEKSKSTSTGSTDLEKLPKFLFKRHRTTRLRLRADAPIMEALEVGWREGLAAARTAEKEFHELASKRKTVGFFLDPNFGGKVFVILTAPVTQALLRNCMDACAAHEQRKLMLALRLHEMDHGVLPATLDALVPAYLPEVPEDIYTGTPMSWNSRERIAYSVGRNGTDDGGQINEEKPGKGPDFGIRYSATPSTNGPAE